MTRLFLSLYLFIVVSLVLLTLGLEQVFFQNDDMLSQEQQAWVSVIETYKSRPKALETLLQHSGIPFSYHNRSELALSAPITKSLEQQQLVHGFGEDLWQIYVPIDDGRIMTVRFTQAKEDLSNWWIYSSVFFVLLGVLIAVWIYPLWRDLSKLVSATKAVKQDGSFDIPELNNSSPLKDVANALSSLEGKITSLLASQRELTGAVTHELKTPIARLKFALASETALSPAQVIEARNDIDDLDKLIQEMLEYNKLSSHQVELHMEDIPVLDLCQQRVKHFLSMTALTIELKGENPILTADGHFVARALDNLLSNAIRHAQSKVMVLVESSDTGIYVHVDDDGAGISDKQKARIIEPFYRSDEGRNRDEGGTGLGLAIVKRIQQWHGGELFVNDSEIGGARFSMFYTTDMA
ncbi:ATP-binding protein [Ningiella sp. W23]|uniref:ATP-binding protein n=1 Tax=Ningiella sp. W23 TaxID=3023715 RepID=UPI0037575442